MRCSSIGLIVTLTLAILVVPLAADAQQLVKVTRIGYLFLGEGPQSPSVEALRQGLREFGYREGQNIALEFRSAEGKLDRLPALAVELVQLKVDVIVAGNTAIARAAQHATSTIPIVMAGADEPVRTGLVASLARPGGNMTGVSNSATDLRDRKSVV